MQPSHVAVALGVIVALGGVFLWLAACRLLPPHANVISDSGWIGKFIGAGCFIGGGIGGLYVCVCRDSEPAPQEIWQKMQERVPERALTFRTPRSRNEKTHLSKIALPSTMSSQGAHAVLAYYLIQCFHQDAKSCPERTWPYAVYLMIRNGCIDEERLKIGNFTVGEGGEDAFSTRDIPCCPVSLHQMICQLSQRDQLTVESCLLGTGAGDQVQEICDAVDVLSEQLKQRYPFEVRIGGGIFYGGFPCSVCSVQLPEMLIEYVQRASEEFRCTVPNFEYKKYQSAIWTLALIDLLSTERTEEHGLWLGQQQDRFQTYEHLIDIFNPSQDRHNDPRQLVNLLRYPTSRATIRADVLQGRILHRSILNVLEPVREAAILLYHEAFTQAEHSQPQKSVSNSGESMAQAVEKMFTIDRTEGESEGVRSAIMAALVSIMKSHRLKDPQKQRRKIVDAMQKSMEGMVHAWVNQSMHVPEVDQRGIEMVMHYTPPQGEVPIEAYLQSAGARLPFSRILSAQDYACQGDRTQARLLALAHYVDQLDDAHLPIVEIALEALARALQRQLAIYDASQACVIDERGAVLPTRLFGQAGAPRLPLYCEGTHYYPLVIPVKKVKKKAPKRHLAGVATEKSSQHNALQSFNKK